VLMTFRKIIPWILAAVVAAGSGNAPAASRGLDLEYKASEAANAPVGGSVRLYEASYALVIGNDAYKTWPRLSNAVRDAELVAVELERQGFEVTLKRNLTSTQLKSVLEEFYIVKGADKNARLMVWYAGHGETVNGEGYLVPVDAPRITSGTAFKRKALSLRRFGEYVRQAEAKHAMAVFDSCFAGTIFGSTRSKPPPAVTRSTGLPVRQFLTSGDAGETVSDDGTFRKLFIRALRGEERADANGDGYLTGSELGNYLGDRVVNLQMGQTPRYGKLRDPDYDRGDFVFSLGGPAKKSKPVAADKEALFWSAIKDSKRAPDFEAYLSQYRNGTFTSLARIRLNELKGAKVASLATRPEVPIAIEEMYVSYFALKTAILRSGPSTSSEIVGSLPKGKDAVVNGRVKGKNWYRLKDGSFVFGSLVEQVDPMDVGSMTPTGALAISKLLGVNSEDEDHVVGPNLTTSIWIGQNFEFGEKSYLTFFTITRDTEKTCHVCKVPIGAITFRQEYGRWIMVGKQRKVSIGGSWGGLPDISRLENIVKTDRRIVLGYKHDYFAHGWHDEKYYLLSFDGEKWNDIGAVLTGQSNEGACTSSDENSPPCQAYDGTIEVLNSVSKGMPDLVVKKKGTVVNWQQDPPDTVVPAEDQIYTFDGSKYD
jgi:hypothetical protein